MTLDYDAAISADSATFLAAVQSAEPDARVPSCPDWNADDLLFHLAGVQHFWAAIVGGAQEDEVPELERPAGREELVEAFRAATSRLQSALAEAPDDRAAWTWHDTDHTVGFIRRRQAHEALIHRVDAEQAAGLVSLLPADLAADGVLECLAVMYAGTPDWGSFTGEGRLLAFKGTDTGSRVVVELGRFTGTHPDGRELDEPDIGIREDTPQDVDATFRATAADLDLWLWHRADDAVVLAEGDEDAISRVRQILRHPIT